MEGLGAKIRELRLSKGLSQGDIEKRSGMLRCYLSRVENGQISPSLTNLARLASAIGIPHRKLLQLRDPSNPLPDPGPGAERRRAPVLLLEVRSLAGRLTDLERKRLLQLIRQFAQFNARKVN